MRLWHEKMIKQLPRQQLLGQHRECCALRGKGWQKPHATINYIFEYPFTRLVAYHFLVMEEMQVRGYNVSKEWFNPSYRGKALGYMAVDNPIADEVHQLKEEGSIYKEHDKAYLEDCLSNLENKQITIDRNDII